MRRILSRMGDEKRQTIHNGRWMLNAGSLSIVHRLLLLVCCGLLSGCLLISGEQTSLDQQDSNGTVATTFVSAEGSEIRTITVADTMIMVKVIVMVSVDSGDLRLDVLQPDGSVAFTVEGHPDEQVTRTSRIQTDTQGRIRYRVYAQGAQNGSFQVLFQSV